MVIHLEVFETCNLTIPVLKMSPITCPTSLILLTTNRTATNTPVSNRLQMHLELCESVCVHLTGARRPRRLPPPPDIPWSLPALPYATPLPGTIHTLHTSPYPPQPDHSSHLYLYCPNALFYRLNKNIYSKRMTIPKPH